MAAIPEVPDDDPIGIAPWRQWDVARRSRTRITAAHGRTSTRSS